MSASRGSACVAAPASLSPRCGRRGAGARRPVRRRRGAPRHPRPAPAARAEQRAGARAPERADGADVDADRAAASAACSTCNGSIEAQRADNARAARPDRAARAQTSPSCSGKQTDIAAGRRRAHPQGRAAEGDGRRQGVQRRPRGKAQLRRGARAAFARGEFDRAATGVRRLAEALSRNSGYRQSALFWLGNAQYARRDYKEAIATFRSLVATRARTARARPRRCSPIAELPGRAQGHQGGAQDDRRSDQDVSEVGSRAGRTREAGGAAMTPAPAGVGIAVADGDADLERRFGGLRRLYGDAGYARDPRRPHRRRRPRRRRLVGARGAGAQRRRRADADRPRPRRRVEHQPPGPGARRDARPGQGRRARASASPRSIRAARCTAIEEFVDAGNWPGAAAARRVDAVIDACDQVPRQGGAGGVGAARRGTPLVTRRRRRRQARGAERSRSTTSADVTHDPLLAALRQRLRKQHGAPRAGRASASACVFSREPVRAAGGRRPATATAGSTATATARASRVTATFGMVRRELRARTRRGCAADRASASRRLIIMGSAGR